MAEMRSILERDFLVIVQIHKTACQPASRWHESDVVLAVYLQYIHFTSNAES